MYGYGWGDSSKNRVICLNYETLLIKRKTPKEVKKKRTDIEISTYKQFRFINCTLAFGLILYFAKNPKLV